MAVPDNLFSTPGDVQLPPVPSIGAPSNPPAAGDFPYPNYFFVIGSPQGAVSEKNPPTVSATLSGAYDPLSRHGAADVPTLKRRASGVLQEPDVGAWAAADGPTGYYYVGVHDAGQDPTPHAGLGSDAVLLDLPAASGQSVRAALARHQQSELQSHGGGRRDALPLH